MQVAEAFSFLHASLKEWNLEGAFFEAELLLMHFLKMDRAELHRDPQKQIETKQWSVLRAALEQRLSGQPMAYILGYKDFYKMRFHVGPGVLIPRPETELIIDTALEKGPFLNIADLGTGSGCIGLSLLGEFAEARLWACDLSQEAHHYFHENAKQLNFMGRIEYSLGDVVDNKVENRFDLVVSNPPYIATNDDRVEEDVKRYEPHQALYAPNNGLYFYQTWLPWAVLALQKNGWLIFEFGQGQAKDIENILQSLPVKNCEIKKDLAGIERIICAQKE